MTKARRRWGDTETAAEKAQRRRLEWLGHLARMPDYRIPTSTVAGWLPNQALAGGQGKDGEM